MKQAANSAVNEQNSLANEILSLKSILEIKNALIEEYKKNSIDATSESLKQLESKAQEQSIKLAESLQAKNKELEDQCNELKEQNSKFKQAVANISEKFEQVKQKEKEYPVDEFLRLRCHVKMLETEIEEKVRMHESQLEMVSSVIYGLGLSYLIENFQTQFAATANESMLKQRKDNMGHK